MKKKKEIPVGFQIAKSVCDYLNQHPEKGRPRADYLTDPFKKEWDDDPNNDDDDDDEKKDDDGNDDDDDDN